MNQQLQPQEQIEALRVQAMWLSTVIISLVAAGAVVFFLPKVVSMVKEKK